MRLAWEGVSWRLASLTTLSSRRSGSLVSRGGQAEYAGVHVAPPLTETMGRDPKVLVICHLRASRLKMAIV